MRVEPIMLREKRFNFLPQRFLYRGTEQQVRRIQRTWDAAATWKRNARHYFEVRCTDDRCFRLVHDIALNAWFAER